MREPSRYGAVARVLHWLMAVLVISLVFLGAAMVDSVAPWQPAAVGWHKMLGLLVLALVVVRLFNRLRHPAPALPRDLPRIQVAMARGMHVALYGLLFAQPLVGWAMQGAAGLPLVVAGGWVVPALTAPDLALYGTLREAHAVMAYTLFALVLLHVAAALYHGLIRRDGVLQSMVSGAVDAEGMPGDVPPAVPSQASPAGPDSTAG